MGADGAACHVECAGRAIHDEGEGGDKMVEREKWEKGSSSFTKGEERSILESTLPSPKAKSTAQKEAEKRGAARRNVSGEDSNGSVGPYNGH